MLQKLEDLIFKAIQEDLEMSFYSGGSQVNHSQRELGAFMMVNGLKILERLKNDT